MRRIIATKRDGGVLSGDDLAYVARGLADGTLSDAQAGAFAMAVRLNGMTMDERVALTTAMRDSGDVLQWALPGPVLDKHSTGGVGDNVSLILAPALAACGAYVPMISGRGLGHTGGTLDKLDAITGFRSEVDEDTLRRVVDDVGCAIVGATGNIAPADKRLYTVRDVTATVSSIDLITASILSKKLAAGLQGLVLDVKVGSGAFLDDAPGLARALCDVANGAGCKTTAIISDMNEPLASAAGNAVEVLNAVALLRGDQVDGRLWDVVVALGGALLVLGDLAQNDVQGRDMIGDALQSGAAGERFGRMVAALGGPNDLMDKPRKSLPHAPVVGAVEAARSGFVSTIDVRALGMAVVDMGGGRRQLDDTLDYSAGLVDIAPLGVWVETGDALATVHAGSDAKLKQAQQSVARAYALADKPPPETPLIVAPVD